MKKYIWGILRIAMGWTFLWAFIDKLWGLGFTTTAEQSWLAGGSPTMGFLKFATKGPFAEIFQSMAGSELVDWLFMLGLLFIGLAFIFGICMRLASWAGVIMLVLMYLAGFMPPEHNPFLDDHLINALLIIALVASGSGSQLGFGNQWSRFVAKCPILK